MHLFEARTADEAWLQAAAKLSEDGHARPQPSRAGQTEELLGAVFSIENPRQRWTTSRTPAINPAFALAEVVWIVCGRQDASFLNFWNPKLPHFAGNAKNYHGAYGYRLKRHHGLDQLERAYHALLNNTETRQVVLQIWDSAVDFPTDTGSPRNTDIPCNICSFAKIREGKLHWTQVVRSNDLFLGVPHNFVQFTSLQEILAAWLNIEVGQYRHLSDCLHIYTRDRKHLDVTDKIQVEHNTDILRFSKAESDKYFSCLSKRMDKMTGALLTQRGLRHLVAHDELPLALQNWLLVIAADCARRHRWVELSYEFMTQCSNPALTQLWERWLSRWWSARKEEVVSEEAIIYAQPWLPLRFA